MGNMILSESITQRSGNALVGQCSLGISLDVASVVMAVLLIQCLSVACSLKLICFKSIKDSVFIRETSLYDANGEKISVIKYYTQW